MGECNSVLVGVSGHLLNWLQSVQRRCSTDLLDEVVRIHNQLCSPNSTVCELQSGYNSSCVFLRIVVFMTLRRYTSPRSFTEPPTSMVAAACVLPPHPRCLFNPSASVATRRSCISRGGITCMEQPASRRQKRTVPADLPTAFKHVTVTALKDVTVSASSSPPLQSSHVNCVKCPCNTSL